jgi:hypothetical protein
MFKDGEDRVGLWGKSNYSNVRGGGNCEAISDGVGVSL